MNSVLSIRCPLPRCGQDNPAEAAQCTRCGTPLQAYHRLLLLPDFLFNQGLEHAQRGQYAEAEAFCQAALVYAPRDTELILLLAETQAARGHLPAARATLSRATEKPIPDERLKDHHGALSDLLKVSAAEPATGQPAPRPGASYGKSHRPKHKKKHR